ncbi:Helix-turn-helix domain [Turicibacter sanguinis]|nr:Helix-turn-helix domain [Turicibacter sanguinis]
MKSNKGLIISIIILACTIMIGSSIIATKVSTAINTNSIDSKENSQVLGINEAADYLHLSEEQVIRMINIEKTDLEEDGIFSGIMLPYFTVDGQYYFCKAELDNWLKEVANEHTEYNTAEGWRKQKITF